MPLFSALWLAACITGPSAIGSENGMQISTMSVPPSTRAEAFERNASGDGSPPVRYVTRAPSSRDLSSSNLVAIRLSFGEVSCNNLQILVASPGEVNDDRIVGSLSLRKF